MDLFSQKLAEKTLCWASLAEKLRPQSLKDVLNMEQAKGGAELLKHFQKTKKSPSLILTGPPGCGKTSLGRLIAGELGMAYHSLNAVESGVKDLRGAVELARDEWLNHRRQLLVFVDEVHRFSRSQQDVLLPIVEKGEFVLVGATTENPFYFLNRALLSRCRILEMSALTEGAMRILFMRAKTALGIEQQIWDDDLITFLVQRHAGDARAFLNELEILADATAGVNHCTLATIKPLLSEQNHGVEPNGSYFYDLLSAMIKSIRASHPDAALLYATQMLEGGIDPRVIARRLVIAASEDVGNADPRALPLAIAGQQACESVGLPEVAIILAQVITYLSSAPKSRSSYQALFAAKDLITKQGPVKVPGHLCHNERKEKPMSSPVNHLPDGLNISGKIYDPKPIGFEKQILDYLAWLQKQNQS